MSEGWISVHRKLLNWEWFTDVNVSHVFLYCLLRANHTNTKWRGQEIGRGQFITSLDTISKETGLTVRQIRTVLDKLKVTGELTSTASSKSRLISITNYNNYQGHDKHSVKQVTSKRQADDKQVTTDNNVNNNNNEIMKEKKDNTNVLSKEKPAMDVMAVYKALSIQQAPVDQFEDFWEQYGIKEGKDKCKKKYATLLKGGVKHEDIILGVKNYQQECVKQNRERQYIKKPLTFLNGGHWEDDYTNQQLNGVNKNGNNNQSFLAIQEALARL